MKNQWFSVFCMLCASLSLSAQQTKEVSPVTPFVLQYQYMDNDAGGTLIFKTFERQIVAEEQLADGSKVAYLCEMVDGQLKAVKSSRQEAGQKAAAYDFQSVMPFFLRYDKKAQVFGVKQKVYALADFSDAKVFEDYEYQFADVMPQFPGGNQALQAYMKKNIKYPREAQDGGIKGTVLMGFVVERDGSISDVKVLKSVHPLLDAEAERFVKQMPKWQPGIQKGKPVRVKYQMPIRFFFG